jgi:hypothetical protein
MPVMSTRLGMVGLSLILSLSACKKSEPVKLPAAPSALAKPAAPVPGAAAMPARPPLPKAADMKPLLTEDKIARFAVYTRAMSANYGLAMDMGLSAFNKAGTDRKKVEKAVTADDRYAQIAAAGKAALEKAGLTYDEMTKLTQVLTPYYAKIFATSRLFGKPTDAKPAAEAAEPPKPGSPEAMRLKRQEERAAQIETWRKEISDQYGTDALETIKKHEPEFLEITEKMMASATGSSGKKK